MSRLDPGDMDGCSAPQQCRRRLSSVVLALILSSDLTCASSCGAEEPVPLVQRAERRALFPRPPGITRARLPRQRSQSVSYPPRLPNTTVVPASTPSNEEPTPPFTRYDEAGLAISLIIFMVYNCEEYDAANFLDHVKAARYPPEFFVKAVQAILRDAPARSRVLRAEELEHKRGSAVQAILHVLLTEVFKDWSSVRMIPYLTSILSAEFSETALGYLRELLVNAPELMNDLKVTSIENGSFEANRVIFNLYQKLRLYGERETDYLALAETRYVHGSDHLVHYRKEIRDTIRDFNRPPASRNEEPLAEIPVHPSLDLEYQPAQPEEAAPETDETQDPAVPDREAAPVAEVHSPEVVADEVAGHLEDDEVQIDVQDDEASDVHVQIEQQPEPDDTAEEDEQEPFDDEFVQDTPADVAPDVDTLSVVVEAVAITESASEEEAQEMAEIAVVEGIASIPDLPADQPEPVQAESIQYDELIESEEESMELVAIFGDDSWAVLLGSVEPAAEGAMSEPDPGVLPEEHHPDEDIPEIEAVESVQETSESVHEADEPVPEIVDRVLEEPVPEFVDPVPDVEVSPEPVQEATEVIDDQQDHVSELEPEIAQVEPVVQEVEPIPVEPVEVGTSVLPEISVLVVQETLQELVDRVVEEEPVLETIQEQIVEPGPELIQAEVIPDVPEPAVVMVEPTVPADDLAVSPVVTSRSIDDPSLVETTPRPALHSRHQLRNRHSLLRSRSNSFCASGGSGDSKKTAPKPVVPTSRAPVEPPAEEVEARRKARVVSVSRWTALLSIVGFSALGLGMYYLGTLDPIVPL